MCWRIPSLSPGPRAPWPNNTKKRKNSRVPSVCTFSTFGTKELDTCWKIPNKYQTLTAVTFAMEVFNWDNEASLPGTPPQHWATQALGDAFWALSIAANTRAAIFYFWKDIWKNFKKNCEIFKKDFWKKKVQIVQSIYTCFTQDNSIGTWTILDNTERLTTFHDQGIRRTVPQQGRLDKLYLWKEKPKYESVF